MIVVGAIVLAKIVDWRMSKRELPAAAATRYRVLRRSLMTAIIFVGVLSALLVVPQVRAVAAGLLASSAIVGLVVGLAAQRPLANFVAGIVIAFTQPLRLGDLVTVDDVGGRRRGDRAHVHVHQDTPTTQRLVIPNEKLASDTILNSTIVSREKLAQVSIQVPLDKDLDAVVDLLKSETAGDPRADVLVTGLNGTATVTVRSWAPDASELESVRERPAPACRAPACGNRASCEPAAQRSSRRERAVRTCRTIGASAGTARRARRRRKLGALLIVLLGIFAVLAAVGFSGARSIQADCNLQDLRPATIGSNSFIYAADGSLLGSIPAEKNRQPVSLSEMSPWMGKATVAIEDRRFYEHGGIDFQGIARAAVQRHPRRPHGRGRLHDHAAARPQPLHPPPGAHAAPQARRGVPRHQAQRQAREELDPRQLHEHRLLRQPRLRRRGRRADVLLAPREQALAPPVGSPRRAAAGAVDLRPVQEPRARASSGATTC